MFLPFLRLYIKNAVCAGFLAHTADFGPKEVLTRLAKAMGHLQAVTNMVERGEDCSQVLIQLAAVRSALGSTGKIILKDHIEHCLVDAIETGDKETVQQLNRAIDQFIK